MHRITLMAVIAAGSALSALPAQAAEKLNMICSADVVVSRGVQARAKAASGLNTGIGLPVV